MKKIVFSVLVAFLVLAPFGAPKANALSCLPIDMYLKDIVGKSDEIVIFTGTATDQIQADDYTAEVIAVDEAKQGWVENKIFVYHKKNKDWGYLCNHGPAEKGEKGLYVASKDNSTGKYNVYQRLDLTDPLATTLEEGLEDAEIEGGISEITTTDRVNQIMTTITELFKEMQILFNEYVYWKTK